MGGADHGGVGPVLVPGVGGVVGVRPGAEALRVPGRRLPDVGRLLYREVGGFVGLHVQPELVHERPDHGVVDGDPGAGTGGEAGGEVVELLDVEDHVEAEDGPGEGGGPEVLVVPGHVGVEGETVAELWTELGLEITGENE